MKNKFIQILMGVALIVGSLFIATSPASADGVVIPNSCVFTGFSATISQGATLPFRSAYFFVPSGSSCSDINVKSVQGVFQVQLVPMRVHFYPTSSPNWTTPWKSVTAGSNSLTVLASDVFNGTKFTLETATQDGCTGTLVD